MGSKSKSTDKASQTTETTVIDRKAVQQQGQQILDSVIVSNDDKVITAAMQAARAQLETVLDANTASLDKLTDIADLVLDFVNKGQVEISKFGLEALETARQQMADAAAQGTYVVKIADGAIDGAMSMAQQVARDQAQSQRDVLEILAATKTGDYSGLTKELTGMVMIFALGALYLLKR